MKSGGVKKKFDGTKQLLYWMTMIVNVTFYNYL
jgi:hypothetical protein